MFKPTNNQTTAQSDASPTQLICNGGIDSYPALMTEAELIQFLRIPEASQTKNYHNVIENLKRMRGLPCIHISRTPLYPREAILAWIETQTETAKGSK